MFTSWKHLIFESIHACIESDEVRIVKIQTQKHEQEKRKRKSKQVLYSSSATKICLPKTWMGELSLVYNKIEFTYLNIRIRVTLRSSTSSGM